MSVKSIIFNTKEVRAILDGRKTVTRRVIKPQPEMALAYIMAGHNYGKWEYSVFEEEEYKKHHNKNLYWTPPCNGGDILYVRETWAEIKNQDYSHRKYVYRATDSYPFDEKYIVKFRWKSPVIMPKEAARIWLKVTNVRVERLQDITPDGIRKEGINIKPMDYLGKFDYVSSLYFLFSQSWDSTLKESTLEDIGWKTNPWVWVTEFERCDKPDE